MSTLLRRLFRIPRQLLCLPFKSSWLAPSPGQSAFPCAMEVNNASFSQELIKIIQHVADSRFIAFDLEFSGVATRRPAGGSSKFTLQEYYQELRSAAQIYQILQVGLTVVTEDTEKGRYVARPYNCYLSPLPATREQVFRRVWSYNSGAISFLMRNGFNVDRPLQQGVHYLSRQEEAEVRKKLIEDDMARSNIPDMILTEDDAALVEHIKQSVNEWQSLPKEKQEPYVNIPAEDAKDPLPSALNRYQVRLTHQTVRNEYPGLKTQGMGHFVQITNPSSKQQANEKELREQKRELETANAIGFRWIIEAIIGGDISKLPHYYVAAGFPSDEGPKDIQSFLDDLDRKLKSRPRAIVGHNCLTDVINLYRCFIGDLPETVEDFSARLHELFPVILDTKFLAGLGNKRWADTSLQAVEEDLSSVIIPKIHLPPDFDRYLYAANYHEAGFDSFVTAKLGLRLPAKLKREGKDIKSLVESSTPRIGEKTVTAPNKVDAQSAIKPSLEEQDQKPGFTKSLVEIVKAPVASVKSILTGSQTGGQDDSSVSVAAAPSSSPMPTASIALSKERQQPTAVPKSQPPQKVKSISQKSNIFAMLEDDPAETSKDKDIGQERLEGKKRVADMVKKGELLPRWEDEPGFWRLISNKLQANACQEGVLDLLKKN